MIQIIPPRVFRDIFTGGPDGGRGKIEELLGEIERKLGELERKPHH